MPPCPTHVEGGVGSWQKNPRMFQFLIIVTVLCTSVFHNITQESYLNLFDPITRSLEEQTTSKSVSRITSKVITSNIQKCIQIGNAHDLALDVIPAHQ